MSSGIVKISWAEGRRIRKSSRVVMRAGVDARPECKPEGPLGIPICDINDQIDGNRTTPLGLDSTGGGL